jgi:excisionase family DNA binding protein
MADYVLDNGSATRSVGSRYAELLRPSEVARRLGVSRTWLYDAARDGRVPCVRIGGPGGPLRFIPADLDRWIEEARAGWTPGASDPETLRKAADVG